MDYPPRAAMAAVRGAGKEEEILIQAMDYCRKYIERIYPGKDPDPYRTGSGKCGKGFRICTAGSYICVIRTGRSW